MRPSGRPGASVRSPASLDVADTNDVRISSLGLDEPGIGERLRGSALWRLACAHQIARRRRALACDAIKLGSLIDDAAESFAIPGSLAALTDCSTEIYLEC